MTTKKTAKEIETICLNVIRSVLHNTKGKDRIARERAIRGTSPIKRNAPERDHTIWNRLVQNTATELRRMEEWNNSMAPVLVALVFLAPPAMADPVSDDTGFATGLREAIDPHDFKLQSFAPRTVPIVGRTITIPKLKPIKLPWTVRHPNWTKAGKVVNWMIDKAAAAAQIAYGFTKR